MGRAGAKSAEVKELLMKDKEFKAEYVVTSFIISRYLYMRLTP
jgi:hypothetical protein